MHTYQVQSHHTRVVGGNKQEENIDRDLDGQGELSWWRHWRAFLLARKAKPSSFAAVWEFASTMDLQNRNRSSRESVVNREDSMDDVGRGAETPPRDLRSASNASLSSPSSSLIHLPLPEYLAPFPINSHRIRFSFSTQRRAAAFRQSAPASHVRTSYLFLLALILSRLFTVCNCT